MNEFVKHGDKVYLINDMNTFINHFVKNGFETCLQYNLISEVEAQPIS